MQKVNCAVIGCKNSTHQLNKGLWKFVTLIIILLEVASLKGTARTARNRLPCIAYQVF